MNELVTRNHGHKVVVKSWGSELWLVNNHLYCGKRMYIKKGYRCSYHRHLIKHETFFVTKGAVRVECGWSDKEVESVVVLFAGDSMTIPVKMWHRFSSIKGPATMMEFSTTHSDEDVERVEMPWLGDDV